MYICSMEKKIAIIIMVLLLTGISTVMAYEDHRNRHVDSLEMVLRCDNPPKGKDLLIVYLNLMSGYRNTNHERCLQYARKALALSYELNALNARESAWYNLGLLAYGRDEHDKALGYFQQALAVTDSMKNDQRYKVSDIDDNLSQIYGAIGNLYNMQDKALLAIEYYQKALPIFEKYNWLESQTILHHNVAELYLSMGNNEKAEFHYTQAIKTGTASNDSLMMALPRKGLVKIYFDQGKYEQVRQNINFAYAYYHIHRQEEPGDYAEILASLVKMHLMSGHEDLQKAKAFAEEALTYDNGELMSENRYDIHVAAAMVAMHEGNWQQALHHALRSVHENEEEATYSDVGSFEMLAIIYMHLGDHDKASIYIKKVRAMMERFATKNYQSSLSQMEVLYQTKEKESQIERLKKEKRWFLWGGILTALVLFLTAGVFFLLWRGIRLKRRTALIQARLDGEITERVRIARDLHDRLGGTLTALKQNLPKGSTTTVSLVDEAIREMRHVSHHLLPDSLNRYGLRVALRDYCQTLKNVSFSFIGKEERLDKQKEEAIYCMVYELVNNAVKSAQAKHILVHLFVDEQVTAINVSDDGRGITDEERKKGIGLGNLQQRVNAIGGTLSILSKPQEGTEVNIEFRNKP